MEKYIVKKAEIEAMEGVEKTHFLNNNAKRINKSLGDMTGLTGLGFHIIEIQPGHESTEYHLHYHEDECAYILEGQATVTLNDEQYQLEAGDFIGYRAGGHPHTMINTGTDILKCIVVGQRLAHDVGDYPNLNKRIYRNKDMSWDVVNKEDINHPKNAGKK